MELVLAIILLAAGFFIFASNKNRIVRSPVLIFVFLWAGVLFMSSFNAYGLYSVSFVATCLVALHLASFLLGYSFKASGSSRNKQAQFVSISYSSEKLFKGNILPLIATIMCIPLIILAYRYISYASSHIIGTRSIRFEVGALFTTTAGAVLYNYFGAAYFNIFSVIFIYGIISKKIKLKLFVPCAVGLACYLVIGFGRLVFLQLLLTFFVTYLLVQRKNGKPWSFKKTLVLLLVGIAFLFALVVVTALRRGLKISVSNFWGIFEDTFSETISQIYRYMEGPIRAFDYSVTHYSDSFGFHFGRMALAGFDEIIIYVLHFFGLDFTTMNNLSAAVTTIDVPVGVDSTIIALFTGLFDPYFDFSFVGVAIYSFALGYAVAWVAKKVSKNGVSLSLVILYIYLLYIIVMLPIKTIFNSPDAIFTILIVYMWNKFENKKRLSASACLRIPVETHINKGVN